MGGMTGLRENCNMMIDATEKDLNDEENQDNQLRTAIGAKWTALPSNTMNQPYRQNIAMYRTKIQQAQSQDEVSSKRFNEQKGELEILAKTPQDLIAMMPVSESSADLASRPVSQAIKQALTNIDNAKLKKDELLKEIVEKLANLNMIEQLLEVHQGQKSKDEVFSAKKEEFNQQFAHLAEQDALVTSSNKVIEENFNEFSKMKQSIAIDPTR